MSGGWSLCSASDTLGRQSGARFGDLSIHQRFLRTGPDHGWIIGLTGENLAGHIGEELNRFCLVVRVETRLIPALAERSAIIEIFVPGIGVALVLVSADVVAVIQHLEITVLFDDPCALCSVCFGAFLPNFGAPAAL